MEIPLFLNEEYAKRGIPKYVQWNPAKAAHFVVYGTTGSGKTVATKLIMARIAKYIPDSQIWLSDYKGDSDFGFLNGGERFFRYNETLEGLRGFYTEFRKRQSGESSERNLIMLCIDEWASFLMGLDKKTVEEAKNIMGTILMMGRSFNVHILLSMQRVDSTYFSASSRDQANVVIGLGNLSSEGKEMMFREFKDKMKSDRKQSTGYMITNGTEFTAIQVPYISDMNKMNHYIKQAVNR